MPLFPICQNDGEAMVLAQGPHGLFWRCDLYPACLYAEEATKSRKRGVVAINGHEVMGGGIKSGSQRRPTLYGESTVERAVIRQADDEASQP